MTSEYVITLRQKDGDFKYFVGRSTDLDEEIWSLNKSEARKFKTAPAALFEAQFLKRYSDVEEV